MVTIKQVGEAFHHLFSHLTTPEFRKSNNFASLNEQEMLLLVRFFLLGRFSDVRAEHLSDYWPNKRIDFMVGDVAVEMAVRPYDKGQHRLNQSINTSEINKLVKYDGPSALVLLDFSEDPLTKAELEAEYRKTPSLGAGKHKLYSYSVLYFFTDGEPSWLRLNINPGG
ncbi:MAG: hypothetical protein HQL69_23040 [Magnetococcales bacterium]|nr:hypothetical protein [Magnetococcales bacterium]